MHGYIILFLNYIVLLIELCWRNNIHPHCYSPSPRSELWHVVISDIFNLPNRGNMIQVLLWMSLCIKSLIAKFKPSQAKTSPAWDSPNFACSSLLSVSKTHTGPNQTWSDYLTVPIRSVLFRTGRDRSRQVRTGRDRSGQVTTDQRQVRTSQKSSGQVCTGRDRLGHVGTGQERLFS